ncbi:monocarboxylate transporter 7-like isoform X2 [Oncorhynchus tshawytscha]|uniref:monocarboxylate transporter 7-like isoform X2 n=1 Tax=Oncorhynchus tshawytscha TaxID=74940 RepID=UPI0016365A2E|nr:monocarboxylate transporter 7-like isoform X2 [Oncorhynchus tshawytscha]
MSETNPGDLHSPVVLRDQSTNESHAPSMTVWGSRVKRCMGPIVYTAPPDGGWGWVVAVSFFLVEVFTYGVIKSLGIFLQDLMGEFGESNSRVSWIISICVFVMAFTAPLASVMTNRFGFQTVVMIGGLLVSIGTIASGFTKSINEMYITIGLVAGLGYCLTFLPTITLLSQYFSHRRSLVTAVASTGESFSVFALAPAFSALRDCIGWRYTLVVIGALQGIIIICGVLLRPIIIRPGPATETETDGLADKELKALNTEEEYYSKERLYTKGSSYAKDGSYTLQRDSKLAHRYSLSSGESVNSEVQSLHHQVLEDGSKAGEEIEEVEASSQRCLGSKEKEMEKDEETEEKDEKQTQTLSPQKLLDFSMLREGSFICYALFGLFATLGFFAPQLYIIELSVNRGVMRHRAAHMLSAMAFAEIFGRLSIGWVLGRKLFRGRKPLVLLGCVVLLCLVLVAFTLVWEFWGLAVCCGFYGFFIGTVSSTHIPMLAEEDVVGIERMSSAVGVYVFIQSFAGLAGPPLGGVLVDLTQNYGSAFYSCAVGMSLGAVFLGLVRPAKRGLLCCSTTRPQSISYYSNNTKCSETRLYSRRGHQNLPEPMQVGPGNPVPQREGKEAQDRDSPQDFLEVNLDLDQKTLLKKANR